MRMSDWSSDVCSSDLRLDDRLEARAAAPIELEPRHRLRQSRGKPGPAADARRLAARIALAEDDIVDALGVDAAFLDKRADHGGAEIARGERRERAAEFSDGGPDGRDDRYAAQFHKYWLPGFYGVVVQIARRSEGHTSELQSLMR